jgi:hypothetical protein
MKPLQPLVYSARIKKQTEGAKCVILPDILASWREKFNFRRSLIFDRLHFFI